MALYSLIVLMCRKETTHSLIKQRTFNDVHKTSSGCWLNLPVRTYLNPSFSSNCASSSSELCRVQRRPWRVCELRNFFWLTQMQAKLWTQMLRSVHRRARCARVRVCGTVSLCFSCLFFLALHCIMSVSCQHSNYSHIHHNIYFVPVMNS